MDEIKQQGNNEKRKRTLKDLVNTPFKKAMFVVQLISYVLIPGSPFIGAFIGRSLMLGTAQTGAVILAIFIIGEILFYGSLFFLGKEVLLILKDNFKRWFKK
jgi:hypothetical protein